MTASSAAMLGIATLLSLASAARAEYMVSFEQSGANVVATGSGKLNITGLSSNGSTAVTPLVIDSGTFGAVEFLGAIPTSQSNNVSLWGYVSGPATIGTLTASNNASTGTGTVMGIDAGASGTGLLYLPIGYVSGSAISNSATWDNTTLSGLGLVNGVYTYTWGSGQNADSYVIDIGQPVPEPASALMLLAPLAILVTRRLRRGDSPATGTAT